MFLSSSAGSHWSQLTMWTNISRVDTPEPQHAVVCTDWVVFATMRYEYRKSVQWPLKSVLVVFIYLILKHCMHTPQLLAVLREDQPSESPSISKLNNPERCTYGLKPLDGKKWAVLPLRSNNFKPDCKLPSCWLKCSLRDATAAEFYHPFEWHTPSI